MLTMLLLTRNDWKVGVSFVKLAFGQELDLRACIVTGTRRQQCHRPIFPLNISKSTRVFGNYP